jgi:hypothetical protein
MAQEEAAAPIRVTLEPPPADSSAASSLVKAVGQFIGAVAAVAGAVYLVGTIVLLARLWWTAGISGVQQVPQLARDVLVSLGLEVILIPLGIGAGYAVFRVVVRKREDAPPTSEEKVKTGNYIAVLLLTAAPAVGAWIYAVLSGHGEIHSGSHAFDIVLEVVIGAVLAGIAWGFTLLTLRSWEWLGDGYEEDAERAHPDDEDAQRAFAAEKWNSIGAIVIVALVFAAANVPSWAFAAMSVPLGNATVCPKSGGPVSGYLVGEGGSRTYIAPYNRHVIVSLPNDQVLRVFAGKRSDQPGCPPPPAGGSL